MEIETPKNIHEWIALISVLILPMLGAVAADTRANLDDHNAGTHSHPTLIVKHQELEGQIDSVAKDVAYNRERGDLIQKQNNDAHARQEALLLQILEATKRGGGHALNPIP